MTTPKLSNKEITKNKVKQLIKIKTEISEDLKREYPKLSIKEVNQLADTENDSERSSINSDIIDEADLKGMNSDLVQRYKTK